MKRNPPYGDIADLLKKGQVIPFLGAGVNMGARPPSAKWTEQTKEFLPRGDELSRYLADKIEFPSKDPRERSDLAKVSSYYVEISARKNLLDRLRKIFGQVNCPPCDIHAYLAELAKSADIAASTDLQREFDGLEPKEFKPLLIVTTNYDVLTELALRELQCPYDLVVHPTDRKDREGSVMWWRHGAREHVWERPQDLYIDLDTTTVVYKMHGSVAHQLSEVDSYVITEEDYVNFLSLMINQTAIPPVFTSHFHMRQFLFLGYGLRDWNFRVMLKTLKEPKPQGDASSASDRMPASDAGSPEAAGARPALPASHEAPTPMKSWAIQHKPSAPEESLWVARDVIIYDQDINVFVARLRERTRPLVCYRGQKSTP
jgi:hypothetical protein